MKQNEKQAIVLIAGFAIFFRLWYQSKYPLATNQDFYDYIKQFSKPTERKPTPEPNHHSVFNPHSELRNPK